MRRKLTDEDKIQIGIKSIRGATVKELKEEYGTSLSRMYLFKDIGISLCGCEILQMRIIYLKMNAASQCPVSYEEACEAADLATMEKWGLTADEIKQIETAANADN